MKFFELTVSEHRRSEANVNFFATEAMTSSQFVMNYRTMNYFNRTIELNALPSNKAVEKNYLGKIFDTNKKRLEKTFLFSLSYVA